MAPTAPMFSIIIPCFNAEQTLRATLDSFLSQTCPSWEAIFVDDGSTDGTKALLADAARFHPRLRVVDNPRRGPAAARNHGALAVARGDFIAFCDADDLWAADKLQQMAAVFADSQVEAAYGRVAFFADLPQRASTTSSLGSDPLSIRMLLGENPVCTMSNLTIRRSAFAATGGFDERLCHNEDLEWLIRLVGQGAQVAGVDQVLTYYRKSAGGLSADLPAMRRGREAALITAERFGIRPDAENEAVFLRYLARRALRLDHGAGVALGLALTGLRTSRRGFFNDTRRGWLTLAGALLCPVLPGALRRAMFS